MSELKFFYWQKSIKVFTHKTFFFGFFLLILLSTLYVWQRVMVIKLLKEIDQLKLCLAQEEKKYKYLNIEIAELSSFERIEKIAQEKIGLIHPQKEQIILVEETRLNQPSLPKSLWVRLKNLGKKFYPFEEKGLQAEGIKHDL